MKTKSEKGEGEKIIVIINNEKKQRGLIVSCEVITVKNE